MERLDDIYNAQIIGMGIVDPDPIDDGNGLAGAQALLYTDTVNLVSHLQGVLSNYNTQAHKNLRIQAAGGPNVAGE